MNVWMIFCLCCLGVVIGFFSLHSMRGSPKGLQTLIGFNAAVFAPLVCRVLDILPPTQHMEWLAYYPGVVAGMGLYGSLAWRRIRFDLILNEDVLSKKKQQDG